MARVLSIVGALGVVVCANACSLFIEDLSANAESDEGTPNAGLPSRAPPSNEPAVPKSSPGGNDAGGGGGGGGSLPQEDAGDGCEIATKTASLAVNVSTGSGRPAWSNALGARTKNDGQLAAMTMPAGVPSDRLSATAFRFEIPADNLIRGVLVEVTRSSATGTARDLNPHLALPSENAPPTAVSAPMYWSNTPHAALYGGLANTWGKTLTPAMVNDASFGFNVSVEGSSTAQTSASVDEVKISVRHCRP